ncbi:hypothetical protein K3729_18495 (plasmid) [Rhodobacteraceae bacterium S2214]|nr:hypothetical protein K3729_18495 [Rhodobacteraceae bacterium S2214]
MTEQLITTIGQAIMRSAKTSAPEWDYAGYMFETKDGISSSGTKFIFHDGKRLPLDLDRTGRRAITDSFKQLRSETQIDGDAPWIKCLAVLRRDGDMKMLFEFNDWSRWTISPATVDQAYAILVGEIFPETK